MAPTQDGRVMRVDSPLGKDALLLESFTGTESVSSPFSFDVSVLATKAVKPDELLEKPLTLTVSHPVESKERIIHGVVRSMTAMGREGGFYMYQLQMVPWLWFLSLNHDSRIFQKMTAKDIVTKIFKDAKYADFRFDTQGQFPTREFTVQYEESDLAFVSRLLEEEGVFYFFEHTKDKHTLVLADHQGALKTSPIQKDVEFRPGMQGLSTEGVLESVYVESAIHTGLVHLQDYNYEKPTAKLLVNEKHAKGIGKFEHFHYPGRYGEPGDGRRFVRIRMEEQEAQGATLQAFGNSIGLIPGYRFNLAESDGHDGDYLVLEVSHHSGSLDYSSSDAEEPDYRSGLVAVPYATPFRPPRSTPRPVINGAQTAVVVGPSAEEIYTDKYGRVKVQFHWDREGKLDENSSCWIRVASTWAGNKWGAIQIPRIGQEVVVEFLEGDPDRPLITGSVWNAQQMPVFDATPTQSGWKSRSSKSGAARANEFRWEDKKGEEEIYLHAEKDMNFAVVNNHTETVDVDHVVTIGNDETITIKNDQAIAVENNQTVEIEKDQSITLNSGDRKIELQAGDLITKLAAGEIIYEAAKAITFKVGASSVKIEPSAITMSTPQVKIEGQTGVEVSGLTVKVEADTNLDLKAGINATLEGGVGATLKGGAMAEVKGAMVQVNGSGMLTAKGGITMIG